MTGLHFHALTVSEVRRDTDDAVVVSFDVPADLADSFRFSAGQYLTLRSTALGGDVRRSYSICAAPGDALRVGIRHVPDGAFSGWLHRSLKAGDTLEAMEPQGRFGAAVGQPARHVLLVAGGSGITPILSILKTLLAADADTQCTLLYGNRSAASTMFKEEIEDLKNRHLTRLSVHPVFSREVVDSPLNAGRLDGDKIAAFLRLAGRIDEAYVCGPHAMNDEVEAALQGAGLSHEHIHIERFGVPPSEPVQRGPVAGEVSGARIVVIRDGVTRELAFESGDESILAAAGRAGLDVPYSCRSGVCATCRAKVLEGKVSMTRNFALEADDIAKGFVLTCQAHPLSERVVVSYDER